MDGVTAILGSLIDYGLFCVDTRGKFLFRAPFKTTKNQVFLGEYMSTTIYLFMEANDITQNFAIDMKNMSDFVEMVANPLVQVNYIELTPTGKTYKHALRELLKRKSLHPEIESDGYIFGDMHTKRQFKWKPMHLTTIDFYVKYAAGSIHFYVGNNIRYAMKRRNRPNIPVPYWFGKKPYVHVYHASQKDPADKWKGFNNKIVECKYTRDRKWSPYKLRPDKQFANNYLTVMNTLKIIKRPINLNDLI